MIRLEDHNGVRLVTLDRREKRNALSVEMMQELLQVLMQARSESSPPRALVLRGTGECFCAGFDLAACRDDALVLDQLLTSLFDVVTEIRSLEYPVVVAAHGAAIAGGCALLCGADIVVTNAAAKLGYPVVRLGISPAVNAVFLRDVIGDARTRELLLEGSQIDGKAAFACGLASHCVATPAEVEPLAMSLASRFAEKPVHALQATKRWLNELESTSDPIFARRGLDASLSITGSIEQHERLAKLWAR